MRSWLGVVAMATVVVAGAGLAVTSGAAAAIPSTQAKTVASQRARIAVSPRAKAGALASRLVAEMKFPAGTKPAVLRSIPAALRDDGPAGPHWARAERVLLAPDKPAAVWAVLLAHKPFSSPGSMGTAGSNGPEGTSALLAAPEAGIAAAQAAVWLEPWHNGTLIAAYGYATWLPVRTAAEHLNPASFGSVTVIASTVIPRSGTVKRTFASSAVIAKITKFLNSRPTAPELAIPCPMLATTYQAAFAPKANGQSWVTVSASGCLTDQVTVHGVVQPMLWDTSGGLAKLLATLLR